jgi:hypothetical protein
VKLHASTLLDDVSCLVCYSVKTGHSTEGNPLTASIGFSAYASGSFFRLIPYIGLHSANIMPCTEGSLDLI